MISMLPLPPANKVPWNLGHAAALGRRGAGMGIHDDGDALRFQEVSESTGSALKADPLEISPDLGTSLVVAANPDLDWLEQPSDLRGETLAGEMPSDLRASMLAVGSPQVWGLPLRGKTPANFRASMLWRTPQMSGVPGFGAVLRFELSFSGGGLSGFALSSGDGSRFRLISDSEVKPNLVLPPTCPQI